jgi:CRISPR-associated exonuclease Cas4
MTISLIIIASGVIIIGLMLLFFASRKKRQLGILGKNKHFYEDTQGKPGELLYAKTIPLVGKPDYLIREHGMILPVEFKSGRTPAYPYTSHTMQLMAYCFLVEEHFGIRPLGGYLRYPKGEFKIAYTDEAKKSVLQIVQEIQQNKQKNTEQHCKHKEHYN